MFRLKLKWKLELFLSLFGILVGVLNVCADEAGRRVRKITGQKIDWASPVGLKTGPIAISNDMVVLGTTEAGLLESEEEVLSGGMIVCLDRESGQRVWSLRHSRRGPLSADHPFSGIRSRPVIDGNRVYYISNRNELVCLDLAGFHDEENDGPFMGEKETSNQAADISWMLDLTTEFNVKKMDAGNGSNPISSPLIVGDLVFCVTGNGSSFEYGQKEGEEFVPRPDAPALVALKKATGKLVWSSSLPGKDTLYHWASPVLAQVDDERLVLFPGGDGCLYVFGLDGQLMWKVDLNPPSATRWTIHERGTRRFFLASPVVVGEKAYASLHQDTEGSREGSGIFTIRLNETKASENRIQGEFVPADYSGTYASLAIHDGIGFTFAEEQGQLIAFDLQEQHEFWRSGQEMWSGKAHNGRSDWFSSPVIYQGVVYIAYNNSVFAYKADRNRKLLVRFDFENSVMGTPVIVEGKLFVVSGRELIVTSL